MDFTGSGFASYLAIIGLHSAAFIEYVLCLSSHTWCIEQQEMWSSYSLGSTTHRVKGFEDMRSQACFNGAVTKGAEQK
jgi:hypothetical protein